MMNNFNQDPTSTIVWEQLDAGTETYTGIKNNFIFQCSYSKATRDWTIYAKHSEKDIYFNSEAETLDEAKLFCENFNFINYPCKGEDVYRGINKSINALYYF